MNPRFHNLLALSLAVCVLAGCANLIGPRKVELPMATLQEGIDRRFPLNERVLELFDIELSGPQLLLQPGPGRVALAMNAALKPPFTSRSWRGSLALSGKLYVDPVRNAVLMAEPRVERFLIDGVNPVFQRQLAKVANVVVQQIASDVPIYHFKPEDLRFAGVQFVPSGLTTTADSLVVSLEPKR